MTAPVWVIDASATLDVLVGAADARAFAERALPVPGSLAAPELLDLEVAQVLRRWISRPGADVDALEAAFAIYLDLDVERYRHPPLMPRVWALRHNVSAYDAAYVALAEALEAPLVTSDSRLARACDGLVETVTLTPPSH